MTPVGVSDRPALTEPCGSAEIWRVRTMPKIWFRKSKQAYYLQIDRHTQKRLGKTRAEADAAYRQWILDQGESLPRQEQKRLTVAELGQAFLDRVKAMRKPKTYESYCYFLVPF